MPQTISNDLLTAIQAGATSLIQLLEIERPDGTVYRCSTATRAMSFDTGDGMEVFNSGGFDPTDIQATSSDGIGGLTLIAYFTAGLTQIDVRTGRFDNSRARLYIADWKNPDFGVCPRFNGSIEASSVTNEGVAQFKLTGAVSRLTAILGEVRTPNCRALFGDERCKFPVDDMKRAAKVVSVLGKTFSLTYDVDGGGAPPDPRSPPPATLWRVRFGGFQRPPSGRGSGTTPGEVYIAEIELRETVGGANAVDPGVNGAIIASEGLTGHVRYLASNAFDGSAITFWGSFGPEKWIGFEFDDPITIQQVAVKAATAASSPNYVVLEYSLDAGVTWLKVIGTETGFTSYWATSEQKLFNQTTASAATSYQAGLLEFTSGENDGDVYEIIAYQELTPDEPTVRLSIAPTRAVAVDDLVFVYPGCDKTLARCRYWNNVVNSRGEPYVPTSTYQGQNRLI